MSIKGNIDKARNFLDLCEKQMNAPAPTQKELAVILSPRPSNWDDYLDHGPIASQHFMVGIEDLPVQERES